MPYPHTQRQIWNCIFYVIFLFALTVGIQFFLEWTMNSILLPLIDWFNGLSLTFKLLIIFLGLPIISYGLAAAVGFVHGMVVLFVFKNLPRSSVVNWISLILFYGNLFICIRATYFIMPSWGFWFVIEFIFLCVFCFAANYSLLYTVNRDKKEDQIMRYIMED